jgi:4-oxalocrotonate tautomerase
MPLQLCAVTFKRVKIMPIVRIEVTPPGLTQEQKKQLVEGVTDLLSSVLNKDPRLTHVIISEIDSSNWGFDGKLAKEHFKSTQS